MWCGARGMGRRRGGFILRRGDIEGLLGPRGNEAPPRIVPRLNFDSSGGGAGRHEEELLQEGGGEENTNFLLVFAFTLFWEELLSRTWKYL